MSGILDHIHSVIVSKNRITALGRTCVELIPDITSVLDVGCGNGQLSSLVMEIRPELEMTGIDVIRQDDVAIPMQLYDGKQFPCESNSFDAVMIVDVLHHTDNPVSILREAIRVSRRYVLIKDHLVDGALADIRLRLMDYIGNYFGHKRFGVSLPYNFLSSAQWKELYNETGLSVVVKRENLKIYPPGFQFLFGKGLHFFDLLQKTKTESIPS